MAPQTVLEVSVDAEPEMLTEYDSSVVGWRGAERLRTEMNRVIRCCEVENGNGGGSGVRRGRYRSERMRRR